MIKTSLCLLALLALALPCVGETTRPLLPLPTGGSAGKIAPPTDPNHFTFVLSGDNRAAGRNVPAPPTAAEIFSETRLLQPALCLWTGDCIFGSDDTVGEAAAEYDVFLACALSAATPVYNSPGNHEIFDRKEMETLYTSKMGRLYGSFDYGNSHFIALDTEEIGHEGGIGKAQRDWLQHDLAANQKAAHIFVFMHHPLFPKVAKEGFPDAANRDDIHKLFVQYGVKHVFSGHEHLYYQSVHDGVTYTVSGGGGAPSDADPREGGFQHYLLFEIDGDKVTATVLQPWRLFAQVAPVQPDGSCSAVVSNYNDADLSVCVELPSDRFGKNAVLTASSTYKGKTHPLEATLVPSRVPGVLTVRVTVPKHRAAFVTIGPKR